MDHIGTIKQFDTFLNSLEANLKEPHLIEKEKLLSMLEDIRETLLRIEIIGTIIKSQKISRFSHPIKKSRQSKFLQLAETITKVEQRPGTPLIIKSRMLFPTEGKIRLSTEKSEDGSLSVTDTISVESTGKIGITHKTERGSMQAFIGYEGISPEGSLVLKQESDDTTKEAWDPAFKREITTGKELREEMSPLDIISDFHWELSMVLHDLTNRAKEIDPNLPSTYLSHPLAPQPSQTPSFD